MATYAVFELEAVQDLMRYAITTTHDLNAAVAAVHDNSDDDEQPLVVIDVTTLYRTVPAGNQPESRFVTKEGERHAF